MRLDENAVKSCNETLLTTNCSLPPVIKRTPCCKGRPACASASWVLGRGRSSHTHTFGGRYSYQQRSPFLFLLSFVFQTWISPVFCPYRRARRPFPINIPANHPVQSHCGQHKPPQITSSHSALRFCSSTHEGHLPTHPSQVSADGGQPSPERGQGWASLAAPAAASDAPQARKTCSCNLPSFLPFTSLGYAWSYWAHWMQWNNKRTRFSHLPVFCWFCDTHHLRVAPDKHPSLARWHRAASFCYS